MPTEIYISFVTIRECTLANNAIQYWHFNIRWTCACQNMATSIYIYCFDKMTTKFLTCTLYIKLLKMQSTCWIY